MRRIAAQALGRPSMARLPGLGRQGTRTGRPDRSVRQNAGGVGQLQRRDIGAQIAVVAIASIQQYHATRQTRRAGPA